MTAHGDFLSNTREYDYLVGIRDWSDANPEDIANEDIHETSYFGGGRRVQRHAGHKDLIDLAFVQEKGQDLIGPEYHEKPG